MSSSTSAQVKKVDDIDFGALAVSSAKSIIKNRPVGVSLWVLGLLLAAFANGFKVDDLTRESYQVTLNMAEEVDRKELSKAVRHLKTTQDRHYELKGWFWQCDDKCSKALDKVNMAQSEVNRLQKKKDQIMSEARREVGIWSVYGVQEVRDGFWAAWKAGKEWAARHTMMDAMFMAIGGKEEKLSEFVFKLLMQYIVNLTLGLVGGFVYFVYNTYTLVTSYGEPMLSAVAFFLLVLVAGMSLVGTYLVSIYGTVAAGGVYLVKKAAAAQALKGEQGRRPQQVQYGQYGSGRVGGMGGGMGGGMRRPHGD